MELFLVRCVRVPPFITGERCTGPIMVCSTIYVNIDYTVGSRPSYIDPIPAQSLGRLTPSLEAMIKTTHRCHPRVSPTYAHAHIQILQESPPEHGSKSAIPRCKTVLMFPRVAQKPRLLTMSITPKRRHQPQIVQTDSRPGLENLGSCAISHAGKPPTCS